MAPTIASVTAQGRSIEEPLSSLLSPGARRRARRGQPVDQAAASRPVGEQSMRDRFTYRGDSLWWFTELYLHKMRRLERAAATIFALEAARERYSPARIEIRDATPRPKHRGGVRPCAWRADRRARGPGTRTRSQLVELSDRIDARLLARPIPAGQAACYRCAGGGIRPHRVLENCRGRRRPTTGGRRSRARCHRDAGRARRARVRRRRSQTEFPGAAVVAPARAACGFAASCDAGRTARTARP